MAYTRKKSLLIGINNTGSQNQLRGCHQDVENVAEFLGYRGYSNDPRSQVILRDDKPGPYYPSGHNILVRSSISRTKLSSRNQLTISFLTGGNRLARLRTRYLQLLPLLWPRWPSS